MSLKNNPQRKEQRRQEAEERNARWAKLSPQQKIAELDKTFGAGKGAAKVRAKIAKQVKKEKK